MKKFEDLIPEDSFFKRYLDCWPVSESPSSFLVLAAMSALGAALGRSLWLEMDTRRIYPMLNLVLVGPSGLGKTEAIMYAQNLLIGRIPEATRPMMVEGEATRQKLHDDLAQKPHAIVVAEEMASFFNKQKYMEPMVPYVTELLNYKDRVERRTKQGDVIVVERPAVTFMCGTTPDWLQKMLPDSAIGGGFLPRFLMAYEEHKRKFVPIPELVLTDKQREELAKKRKDIADEYVELLQLKGKFGFKDIEAMHAFEKWAVNHKAATGHLRPFAERAREYVVRLSILMAISRKHKAIEITDIEAAASIYEWSVEKLQQVAVPVTMEGELLQKVLDLFPDGNTELTNKEVQRGMKTFLMPRDSQKYLDDLVQIGELQRSKDGTIKRIFKRKKVKQDEQTL